MINDVIDFKVVLISNAGKVAVSESAKYFQTRGVRVKSREKEGDELRRWDE